MDRFVIMVDAGYLLRQSIEVVSNRTSSKRAELEIGDPAGLIRLLVEKTRNVLDLGDRELLRVYWYDGVMLSGRTQQQKSIVDLPDVNFRAGTVNSVGQQKGVDSLIVTDLIELASHHAVCDAAVITGDSDLAIGIDLAQRKGVRIAVIGVEDLSAGVSHNQSYEITSRADRVGRIGGAELRPFIRHAHSMSSAPTHPAPAPSEAPSQNAPLTAQEKEKIKALVAEFARSQASLTGAVDPNTKRIDAAVDRALIHDVYQQLAHGKLTNHERNFARTAFRDLVES
ncbi:MAG: NYN domain-containing protein [Xanthomonadaceae bacterium]|nr:NYN domain-containing protein [Xanthomonadaceae bacterium]